MTKILNVDGLLDEKRAITVAGTRYEMKDLTVRDFIAINKMAEEKDKELDGKEQSFGDRIDFMIDIILVRFPTLTKDILLDNCDMEQLNAIVDFARDGKLPEKIALESEVVVEEKSKKK